jgi:hypothetical protein
VGTACVTYADLRYPCWWDVEVEEQDFGPRLDDLVVLSGSTEECVPEHIPSDLEPGDWVEAYGETISTRGTFWVCEGDYYLKEVYTDP